MGWSPQRHGSKKVVKSNIYIHMSSDDTVGGKTKHGVITWWCHNMVVSFCCVWCWMDKPQQQRDIPRESCHKVTTKTTHKVPVTWSHTQQHTHTHNTHTYIHTYIHTYTPIFKKKYSISYSLCIVSSARIFSRLN